MAIPRLYPRLGTELDTKIRTPDPCKVGCVDPRLSSNNVELLMLLGNNITGLVGVEEESSRSYVRYTDGLSSLMLQALLDSPLVRQIELALICTASFNEARMVVCEHCTAKGKLVKASSEIKVYRVSGSDGDAYHILGPPSAVLLPFKGIGQDPTPGKILRRVERQISRSK